MAASGPNDIAIFSPVGNSTTCSSLTFTWSFTGNGTDLTYLAVVGSTDAQPGGGADIVAEVLENNIPLSQQSVTWGAVNVPVGLYQAQLYYQNPNASAPAIVFGGTDLFWINDGDTSCLGSLASWTTPTAVPTSGSSTDTSSHISKGAIAGIVIALVAALAALVLLFVFARRRRRARLSALGVKRKEGRGRGWANMDKVQPSPFVQTVPEVDSNGYPKDKKAGANPFDDSAAAQEVTVHAPTGLPAYSSPVQADFNQEV